VQLDAPHFSDGEARPANASIDQLGDGCGWLSFCMALQKMQVFRCSETAFLVSITRTPISTTSAAGRRGALSIFLIAVSYSHDSALIFKQYIPLLRLAPGDFFFVRLPARAAFLSVNEMVLAGRTPKDYVI
jgi:hypothetical protein